MKRLSVIAVIVILFSGFAFSQGLSQKWQKINYHFNARQYDSVLVLMPSFVRDLEKTKQDDNLSIAYYYFATATLLSTGNIAKTDTLFEKSLSHAAKLPKKEKYLGILQKRNMLYQQFASKIDPYRAKLIYDRLLADESVIGKDRINSLIKRALLFYNQWDDQNAAKHDLFNAAGLTIKLKDPGATKDIMSVFAGNDPDAITEFRAGHQQWFRNNPDLELFVSVSAANRALENDDLQEAYRQLQIARKQLGQNKDIELFKTITLNQYQLYNDLFRYDSAKILIRQDLDFLKKEAKNTPILFALAKKGANLALLASDPPGFKYCIAIMEKNYANSKDPVAARGQLMQLQGDFAFLSGDYNEAENKYLKAEKYLRMLGGIDYLKLMNNLSLVLSKKNKSELALKYLKKQRSIAGQMKQFKYLASAWLNEGIIRLTNDEISEGIEALQMAKKIAAQSKQKNLLMIAQLRLAEAYLQDGFVQAAEDIVHEVQRADLSGLHFYQKFQIWRSLAGFYREQKNTAEALSILKDAVSEAQKVHSFTYLRIFAENLADNFFMIDSLDQAYHYYQMAYDAVRGGSEEVRTRVILSFKLGQVEINQKKYASAEKRFNTAMARLGLENMEKSKDVEMASSAYTHLAMVAYMQGLESNDLLSLTKGLENSQKALSLIEKRSLKTLSGRNSGQNELQNVSTYQLQTDIAAQLYRKTKDDRFYNIAFETSEKSRAKDFVSNIGSQLIAKLNDPSLQKIKNLTDEVGEGEDPFQMAAVTMEASDQKRGLKIKKADNTDWDEVQQKYENVLGQLNTKNKKAVQLVSVNTLNIPALRTLLHEDEVMLDYYASSDKFHLFVISKDDLGYREILLSPVKMRELVQSFREYIQNLNADKKFKTAHVLYDSLIAPVERYLRNKKVIIVPSGALHNLTFSALMKGDRYFIEDNAITYLPNASALQFVAKAQPVPQSPSLFALGNPIAPKMSRLPGTEKEVDSLANIYHQAHVVIGNEATESEAKVELGTTDIAHIASHGIFNFDYPLYSSLALTPDEKNDGRLKVYELYNLNLSKNKLVVLSACETGLGQIKKNDDVVGLVRGFLYAGCPSVISSLWKVDDNATFLLMMKFYNQLHSGKARCEALREAQMKMIADPQFTHPFFWAAFGITGATN